jgi:hypothetical protein
MTFSLPYYIYTPGCVTTVERYKIYCDGIFIYDKKLSTMYLIIDNAKIITFTIDICP